jgi:XamI restriction endonuclease
MQYLKASPMLNADKPQRWNQDIIDSVNLYNNWFLQFAPATFRAERVAATNLVLAAFAQTSDLTDLSDPAIRGNTAVLAVLRMCCAPPLARDRLAGLSQLSNVPVKAMETGRVPRGGSAVIVQLTDTIRSLLDEWLFPWLPNGRPADADRALSASVVADRLCGARSDPIIRNAQEARQLTLLDGWLTAKGYTRLQPAAGAPLSGMTPGTFAVRMNIPVGNRRVVNIPVDVVVQPKKLRSTKLPVLFELKSAGDFANVNKRRKEEAKKMSQLKAQYGPKVEYILLLCGYFNAGYLGYEAAEGIDWVWEHRLADLDTLGF